MTLIPKGIEEKISFIITHAELWEPSPGSVGLDAATVAAVLALGQAAEAKQAEAEAARLNSTQVTAERNDALDAAVKEITLAIQEIKTFAGRSSDPGAVYTAAGLPEPKTPTELKAPPAPTDVTVTFENTNGSALVKWRNPTSVAFMGKTYFFVERKLTEPVAGSGLPVTDWEQIGVSHDRDFTDTALPSGYGQVLYQIRATRNGFLSPYSEPAILKLGIVGVSQVTALTPNGDRTLREEAA